MAGGELKWKRGVENKNLDIDTAVGFFFGWLVAIFQFFIAVSSNSFGSIYKGSKRYNILDPHWSEYMISFVIICLFFSVNVFALVEGAKYLEKEYNYWEIVGNKYDDSGEEYTKEYCLEQAENRFPSVCLLVVFCNIIVFCGVFYCYFDQMEQTFSSCFWLMVLLCIIEIFCIGISGLSWLYTMGVKSDQDYKCDVYFPE